MTDIAAQKDFLSLLADAVPEWPFDEEDPNCRDMHQLRSNLEVLPNGPTYTVRVFIVGYDKYVAEMNILVLRETTTPYVVPSSTLSRDDVNVKTCIVRICRDAIGRAPDSICTALPWKHEGEGETLVFSYVVFVQELQALDRDDNQKRSWLSSGQVDWVVGQIPDLKVLATQCHQALNAFQAAQGRQLVT